MNTLGISEVIFKKRKEKNITQEELASFLMVTKASVSKWERGQSHPDILLLPKIASFFNISIDELIGYEPQLSDSQIRKIIYELMEETSMSTFDEIVDKCKSLIKKYYSCFPFIYSIGLFLLNHIEFLEDKSSIDSYMEYIISLFERVRKESEDLTFKNLATSTQAVCLLQIGRSDEALELLPETERLVSTETLVVSSYIQKEEFEIAQEKLQIFIYKGIFELYNLLLQELNMSLSNWKETAIRIEKLIDAFNIKELNKGLVINYYLLVTKKYLENSDKENAISYAERALNKLILMKESEFELSGDKYFNRVDNWIDKNIILGNKANRSIEMIKESVLNMFLKDEEFKEIRKDSRVEELLKKI